MLNQLIYRFFLLFSVFFEPTDVRKAAKPFQTSSWSSLKYISPNLNELKTIGQFLRCDKSFTSNDLNSILEYGLHISKFVDNSIITMGKSGVLLIKKDQNSSICARHYENDYISEVVNVSGAGDCFASGFILAMLIGKPEEICMSVAFHAARMSIMSTQSVPVRLFDRTHKCWETKMPFKNLL